MKVETKNEEEDKQPPSETPIKPQAKATNKKRTSAPAAEGTPDGKRAKQPTSTTSMWKEVGTTKKALDQAMQRAGTVIRNVETMSSWQGFQRLDDYVDLKTKMTALEGKVRAHPFWHNMQMLSKTMAEMKNKFGTTELDIEVRDRCPDLGKAAASLLDVAVCLARIQAQREASHVVDLE